jgi:hypothetical protein
MTRLGRSTLKYAIICDFWIPDFAMRSVARAVEDPDVLGGG